MRILFVGDIFGSIGRRVLADHLAPLIDAHDIDLCIANGENAAGGRGITRNIARKLRRYGVNVITGGNHSLANSDIFAGPRVYDYVLRPLNMSPAAPGSGKLIYAIPDGRRVGVINLQGRTFSSSSLSCPFRTAIKAAESITHTTPIIIVDFHAEATSEKVCLANYLDGKVSAVLGTHTHVQTSDERILPSGTAFISDTGMTGPEESAIGMKKEAVIRRYVLRGHHPFEPSSDGPMLNAVILDVDENSGCATGISRVYQRVALT